MRNSLSLYECLSFRKFNVRRSTFALVLATPFTFNNLVSHEYIATAPPGTPGHGPNMKDGIYLLFFTSSAIHMHAASAVKSSGLYNVEY